MPDSQADWAMGDGQEETENIGGSNLPLTTKLSRGVASSRILVKIKLNSLSRVCIFKGCWIPGGWESQVSNIYGQEHGLGPVAAPAKASLMPLHHPNILSSPASKVPAPPD